MSKYNKLWQYIKQANADGLTLSFEQVGQIAGVPLDHSFLRYKKELAQYGYQVEKISLKNKTVRFRRVSSQR